MRKQTFASGFLIASLASFFVLMTFLAQPALAQLAKKKLWVAPPRVVNLKNPIAGNDSTIKEGRALYVPYCAPCHGIKGDGKGPANASLSPNPANHTAISMSNETDGTLFYKISEGRSPMPENKSELTEAQIWELVIYLRTLTKVKKS